MCPRVRLRRKIADLGSFRDSSELEEELRNAERLARQL